MRPFAALRVTDQRLRHVDPQGKHLNEALRCAQGDGLALRATAREGKHLKIQRRTRIIPMGSWERATCASLMWVI